MQLKSMRTMRIAMAVLSAAIGCAGWAQQVPPEPVNPHATPEARALLAYIDSISGRATVTGQHNFPNDGSRWTDLAYDFTGKYPGLFGEDFGFSAGDDKDSVLSRPAMIEEVKRQYQNGSIIALTWHEVRPTDDEPVTFRDSVQGHLTDYEWHQLLTPGTPLYNRWCAQVDVVAGYLRQLRDAHVPVLFRPYHEMNGGWFWWGGRPGKDGSAALYRQIYDRFVNVHHLDNLVWVWNVNAPNPGWPAEAEYYPGPQYADVVTMDIYGEFKQDFYTGMLTLAAGKPIALAEVGGLPTPEILDKQPRWAYFMCWSEIIRTGNSPDKLISVYHAPRMVNRDDPRLAAPMAAIRKATEERTGGKLEAEPVSPVTTAEAKALLARLMAVAASGTAVLSGQRNSPSAPEARTAAVVQATGKLPAIYGAVLSSDDLADRRTLVKEVLAAHASHAMVSVIWYAPRLTEGPSAAGLTEGLTDFEWNDLLTPGSPLNKRWCAQVDAMSATLRELQDAGIAVLWNPYPEPNTRGSWWAGRKGVHGSAELYRQLFDRMVNKNGVHNLLWVWESTDRNFRPVALVDMPTDYFPGLLYVDAVEAEVNRMDERFPAGLILGQVAVGKPMGVELSDELPPPEVLTGHAGWVWFLAGPQADSPTHDEALRRLYNDPRVTSLPAPQ
jgi:mannan endo-1,4-beta-mannosidase